MTDRKQTTPTIYDAPDPVEMAKRIPADAETLKAADWLHHELDMQVRNCPLCKGTGKAVHAFDWITNNNPKEKPCKRCTEARQALAAYNAKRGPHQ